VTSERLRLRPLSTSDTDALLAYRGREDVCRYVPFPPMDAEEITRRLAGVWARTTLDAEGQSLTLGVELAGTGELIGDVTLFLQSALHRSGELGYVINPDHGGRGYATEAARAVLRLAFDELMLHRVTARIDTRNASSARLAARLGMRREAHLVRNEWFKGDWRDELDFALLAEEWRGQRPRAD
jgi:RimJ/RimL family protein N-acetyltransferase